MEDQYVAVIRDSKAQEVYRASGSDCMTVESEAIEFYRSNGFTCFGSPMPGVRSLERGNVVNGVSDYDVWVMRLESI